MNRKKIGFPLIRKIKKILFFSVNTKNISSHGLKLSAISLVLHTREITDIFGIRLKNVNILYIFLQYMQIIPHVHMCIVKVKHDIVALLETGLH